MEKIAVKNLDLWYNDFKALKNINLSLPANKISAFIGPSGCGKSTLLKSLNRMNDLVEGCKITGEIRILLVLRLFLRVRFDCSIVQNLKRLTNLLLTQKLLAVLWQRQKLVLAVC